MRAGMLLLLILPVSCQAVRPASEPARLHFSASIAGATLSVIADGKTGSLDLSDHLPAGDLIGSQSIFSARTTRGVFFVIDFVSRSNRGPAAGNCVNGIEEKLVWAAFDSSLHPVNATSALINSCLYSVTASDVQQNARSITVRYDSATEHVRRFLFFRKTAPELGFAFQQEPLSELAPDASGTGR